MACDTINWPLEFQELKRLDTVLKCGICYEYMSTCMMTSCCHNYCSLCIRKFMQYKTQCPTCFEETFEMHLRNNRLIDDVISVYTQMRDKLLQALRIATLALPPSLKDPPQSSPKIGPLPSSQSQLTPKSHSTPTSTKGGVKGFFAPKGEKEKGSGVSVKLFPETSPQVKASQSGDLLVNGVKIPGMFHSPKTATVAKVKEEEMIDCPVCCVSVPKKNINLHLDACLARSNPETQPQPKPKAKKREPLVKRLYHLMPEKALRKSLKDYGLSSTGDRKTLINRIQRYVVLYNAEADKDNPRPIFDLVSQVEREEREEKKQPSILKSMHARMTIDRKTDPEIIEKVNKEYCDANKDSFKKLIDAMKAREGKNIRPLKPAARVPSDDENDFWTNANRPSTSGASSQPRNHEGGGQLKESDSEDDIFIEPSPQKCLSQGRVSLIDWNKTLVASQGGKEKEAVDLDETLEGVSNLDETLPGPSNCEEKSQVDRAPGSDDGEPGGSSFPSALHSSNESLFEPVTARSLSPSLSSQQTKRTGKSPFSSKRRGRKKKDIVTEEDSSDPIENSFREGEELFDHLRSMYPGLDSSESDTYSNIENKDPESEGEEPVEEVVPVRRRSKRKPVPSLDKEVGDRQSARIRSRTKRVRPSSPS